MYRYKISISQKLSYVFIQIEKFSIKYIFIVAEHGNEVIQKNAFFYLWIISAIISTCYTFTWDIKMDWGLLDRNAGENRFLREEIVYAYKVDYMIEIFSSANPQSAELTGSLFVTALVVGVSVYKLFAR